MDDSQLVEHSDSSDSDTATVTVDPTVRGETTVDPKLLGKFGEHLYTAHNAKNTLEAEILHNPTFGSWKFQVHGPGPDGGRPAVHDADEIDDRVAEYATRRDYPDHERLLEAYRDGLALWWVHCGIRDDVRTSPDVGVAEDRAQRIEVAPDADSESAIAQWCYLPLHRTRAFEGRLTARGNEATTVEIGIQTVTADGDLETELATQSVAIGTDWTTAAFDLECPQSALDDLDALYAVTIRPEPGSNVVFDGISLLPDDHVARADPEVISFLQDADLPLLRWPGGNFVSGYHWEEAVGPFEERPTKPNPAWAGLETNRFGTAEFMDFCEAVGCEPMICLNAGNGTAEEAANWVEYCNGDPEGTEYGRLRAEHGHPEPYDVTYWEVGNEVYGPWQTTWTTPGGYADRFARFHEAMTAVDNDIEVLACGNRLTDWNEPLLAECADELDWLTDHVLVGDPVSTDTDLEALYNAHMAFAEQVGREYETVAERMRAAGIDEPTLAITELQLFTTLADDEHDGDDTLEWTDIPTNKTMTEAVYDATFLLEAIRSDGLIGMITHSGVGNHGAGLRKDRERVWADPAYYVHREAFSMVGAHPVKTHLECGTYDTELPVGDHTGELFGAIEPATDVAQLDAVAVSHPAENRLITCLVHRDATAGPLTVTLEVAGESSLESATVSRIGADSMVTQNTRERPEIVALETDQRTETAGAVTLDLEPFTVAFVDCEYE
ncbi:alpha-N-arabinofuranosidase [Natronolimnobius sp. AArcel1]|uniref:alpha-L-arabinofuranosidase C-terminal domain-containing protein n=1 Tax=Natronolimnobius sp. AArcel1 TaxID=1679093 RepID=UPI0013EB283B|nr:alpha-L-arabinofuranosidase C-terminal domain-containing protein [Natronolimnobius sp. AArcel1]NGM69144.1 alpha-N-arabinofuranosidase [Natronolimnobius sp. AArcel1]